MAISKEAAEKQLQALLDAELAILQGAQSYTTPSGQTITRANLSEIRKGIEYYSRILSNYNGNSIKFFRGVPL